MGKRSIQSAAALEADVKKLFDVVNNESDLTLALVATSHIDAALGALLTARFAASSASEKLLDTHGPLKAYGARCHTARALDLIDRDVYADLQVIGQIRNEFAHHHLAFDFGEPTLASLCDRLSVKHPFAAITGSPTPFADATIARTAFSATALFLIGRLLHLAGEIEARKAAASSGASSA